MKRLALVIALTAALAAVPARGLGVEPFTVTDGAGITSMVDVADGTTVRFDGEVISEVLAGGSGHAWVNVLSAGVGIGVWMPDGLASDLRVFGDWDHTGDLVRVTGVLNHACDLHGGDLDVHAIAMDTLARGVHHERPWSWWKALVGLGGLAVAYGGMRRSRRVEERAFE